MNARGAAVRTIVPVATMLLLLGCGSSAGSPAPSAPAATTSAAPAATDEQTQPSEPTATEDAGGAGPSDAGSDPNGPIGGDIGDRSKGSIQAQITGGLTAAVDLPYAPVLARLLMDGPNTAYLPFTDPTKGTIFLTVTEGGLMVQYAGPDQVGLTSAGTPCQFHLDTLDATGAKGTFTCKGMMLVTNGGIGSADMTATFEGHQ